MAQFVETSSVASELTLVAKGLRTIGGKQSVGPETVKFLQQQWGLNPTGNVDTDFRERVLIFQQAHNVTFPSRRIAEDGIIGWQTLAVLSDEHTALANLTGIRRGVRKLPEEVLASGDKVAISSVEEGLNQWAKSKGRTELPTLDTTDNIRDAKFSTVLKAFQKDQHISSTGYFGPRSATAIEKYLPRLADLVLAPRGSATPTPTQTELPSSEAKETNPKTTLSTESEYYLSHSTMLRESPRLARPPLPPDAPFEVQNERAINDSRLQSLVQDQAFRMIAEVRPGEPRPLAEQQKIIGVANIVLDSLSNLKNQQPVTFSRLAANWDTEFNLSGAQLRERIFAGADRYDPKRGPESAGDWVASTMKPVVERLTSEGLPVDRILYRAFDIVRMVLNTEQ